MSYKLNCTEEELQVIKKSLIKDMNKNSSREHETIINKIDRAMPSSGYCNALDAISAYKNEVLGGND